MNGIQNLEKILIFSYYLSSITIIPYCLIYCKPIVLQG
jgi:hypothetical protein